MRRIVVNAGERFGRLTVIGDSTNKMYGKQVIRMIRCECDCGNKGVYALAKLRTGHTRSCGCYQLTRIREVCMTHGASKTGIAHPLYEIWKSMKSRCYDTKQKCYKSYGGRGIDVCVEWLHSFETFYSDMWATYKKGLRIDRIDNDKGYSKENCRRATIKEQSRNRRTNHKYKGKCIIEWAEERCINKGTLRSRILKHGRDNALLIGECKH